ncbi:DNA-deoxyinosine glycosylase [Massilia sp. ST3]|uniref:DNA-deoxyinosine glycosylase n=1 Tax=Massilia sp. ST3 TaxID=2824903 RepID=UPI001B81865F|nr:DNA-deoxyinosine glycosylase [Massilia sp. ST3]MBQ5946295.1 DNA-deoxyinosine glycosylase [Massilia sp. ST3]
MRKKCFAPVVDERTRLLVLGSLPGEKSLAQGEYYANRQNCFWHLMSSVIDADLVTMSYGHKLDELRRCGIGLWDVVAEATREGSLDSRIRAHEKNDLLGLIQSLPELKAIAFNGAKALKLGLKVIGSNAEQFSLLALPSSSAAYTLAVSTKVERWRALRDVLIVPT